MSSGTNFLVCKAKCWFMLLLSLKSKYCFGLDISILKESLGSWRVLDGFSDDGAFVSWAQVHGLFVYLVVPRVKGDSVFCN